MIPAGLLVESMIYGDYATSYRVQGMSTGSPQHIKSYSLGAKNRFFGNKLQVNVASYYYDYTNYKAQIQKQIWLIDDGDKEKDMGEEVFDTVTSTSGIGDGNMYGVDLQTSAVITSQDSMNLSVSYEKSKWKKLFFDYTYNGSYELENGDLVWVAYPDVNYKGKPMFNTPPWTIDLAYNHMFNLWNGGNLKVSINSKFKTAYKLSWSDDDYPGNYQEKCHIENFNAVYNDPNGKWTVSGYVKNIFNYAEKTMFMSGGNSLLTLGAPRTYGAVLSVKF
jgi:iron complex outermembrane recepter protein